NRYYELTGRLNIDSEGLWEFDPPSTVRPSFTPNIFDYLTNAKDPLTGANVTWHYFEPAGAYSFLRPFQKYTFDPDRLPSFDDPPNVFMALASQGKLPNVCFIDPHFAELPPGANDDAPPADVADGQPFVRRIVEAVIKSPQWQRSLLLIVYDEHG